MDITPEHLVGLFPAPTPQDSKYTRGVVGLVTGTQEYPGAGILSASAAASCGAGYVRYSGPPEARMALLMNHPEIVLSARPGQRIDAWVVGSGFPGLFRTETSDDKDRGADVISILSSLDDMDSFAVVDAGALEAFAVADFEPRNCARCVITPHQGEVERLLHLLGDELPAHYPEQNRTATALYLAQKLGCTVVFKGARTVVAGVDGTMFTCPEATHWLATAGSGDVLAGIMGAMIALNAAKLQDKPEMLSQVAAAAVCVHSLAAGMVSEDIYSMHEWMHSHESDGLDDDEDDFDESDDDAEFSKQISELRQLMGIPEIPDSTDASVSLGHGSDDAPESSDGEASDIPDEELAEGHQIILTDLIRALPHAMLILRYTGDDIMDTLNPQNPDEFGQFGGVGGYPGFPFRFGGPLQ